MRHGKKFNHLSRKSAHRKAMLSNMACSLIEHKRIKTTLAKAKALRRYIEPLITKSKKDTTHSRRIAFSYLKQKHAITELFSDIATKISDRKGGYTRILKLSNRLGDNAKMALIELVDYKVRILDAAEGSGTGAITRVMIEFCVPDGTVWRTVGLSTNIIDASVAALGDGMIWKLQHDKIAGPRSISK